ncbi:MAG: hypothetical protein AB7F19_04940 [Candidatus Babeliales bacterium]
MFGFNLNDSQRGYLSLGIGVVLLLFSMGFFISLLKGVIFFFAVFLIAYGLINTHVVQLAWKKIQSLRKGKGK